jgi:hypothetical protein
MKAPFRTVVALCVWSAAAGTVAAQDIERPTLALHDAWSYEVTQTAASWDGGSQLRHVTSFEIVELRQSQYRVDVSTAPKTGSPAEVTRNAAISRDLNAYYREAPALPYTEMKFLQWPLQVGKSWSFTHPRPNGGTFEWNVKVDGWEEVTVPAGRFKAVVVAVSGQIPENPSYVQKRTIWYAPDVKLTVKDEWYTLWTSRRAGGQLWELASYTLAGGPKN